MTDSYFFLTGMNVLSDEEMSHNRFIIYSKGCMRELSNLPILVRHGLCCLFLDDSFSERSLIWLMQIASQKQCHDVS